MVQVPVDAFPPPTASKKAYLSNGLVAFEYGVPTQRYYRTPSITNPSG
jgi:hypothetical protein